MSTYGQGDLVTYLPTGERWTVDAFEPATPYREARVVLGRHGAARETIHAEITDASLNQVELVTPATERSLVITTVGGLLVACDKGGELVSVEPYHRAPAPTA